MERSRVRQMGGSRRWGLIAARSAAAGTLAGLLFWWFVPVGWFAPVAMSPCEKAGRSGDWQHGIEICRESYARNKDDRDLAWAAQASLDGGKLEEAAELARQLLAGPLYGRAHRMLSYVELRGGDGGAATTHAAIAYVAHTLAGAEDERAKDAVSLAQAAWELGNFTAALAAADEALRLSSKLHDPVIELRAYLVRADVLRRLGEYKGAIEAATSAVERATTPFEQVWAHFKSGLCLMEAHQEGLAISEFDEATQANLHGGSPEMSTSIALNEAWLLRWKDPAAALARLNQVAKSLGETVEILVLRGYLAADRGALDEAEGYLTRAESLDPPDADWPWEIVRARAEIAELRGGPSGDVVAEAHYRRAMAMVAALRTTAVARSAYLVSSHRGPYDDLIALLARHGRWRDILEVVLELDASDMLRATADEAAIRAHAWSDLETRPPDQPRMPGPTIEDVLTAWRPRDLVIIIAPAPREIGSGHERAYRLRVTDGQVTGEDVGDASLARTWAGDLFRYPGKADVARALGGMIVPPGPADGVLHVLAVGALGKVPLAALRDDDGSLSIRRRPLVRVLGLQASGPESPGAGPPSIIADPRGNLLSAAVEGLVVARTLGSGVNLSGAYTSFSATRDQLWAARDAALLHVGADVGQLGRWRALHLADGDVGPSEMIQRRLAPRIAVLASCGSAAALDEEGWGSIAAALLESGTAAVIATDRSVDDSESLSLMRDFYAQPDWRTDPARALARVQMLAAGAAASSSATTQVGAWAAFSVLGRPPAIVASSLSSRPQ